jgi:hypothetical protein
MSSMASGGVKVGPVRGIEVGREGGERGRGSAIGYTSTDFST